MFIYILSLQKIWITTGYFTPPTRGVGSETAPEHAPPPLPSTRRAMSNVASSMNEARDSHQRGIELGRIFMINTQQVHLFNQFVPNAV